MEELLERLFRAGSMSEEDLLSLAQECSPWNNLPDGYKRNEVYSRIRVSLKAADVSRGKWPVWINGASSAQNVMGYITSIVNEANMRMIPDELRYEVDCEVLSISREPKNSKQRAKVLLEKLEEHPRGKYLDGEYFPSYSFALRGKDDDPSTWSFRVLDADGKVYPKGIKEAMRFVVDSCKNNTHVKEASMLKTAIEHVIISSGNTGRINVRESLNITEAPSKGSGVIKIVAIQAGLTIDGTKFYPRETLAEALSLFEGAKMFSNHATEQEDFERPEGDINRWVAILENVRLGRGGEIRGDAVIIDPAFKEKVDLLIEQKKLEELRVSINAIGEGTFEEINSIEVFAIKRILAVRSVDFVTEANAGGTSLMESSCAWTDDVDLITAETLIERRPDVVELIESSSKSRKDIEMGNLEDRLEKLEDNLKAHKDESAATIKGLEESVVAEKKKNEELEASITTKEARSAIKAHISALKVEDKLKEHLVSRYGESEDVSEDVIKLIDQDVEMFSGSKKVKESASVEGEGEGDESSDEDDEEAKGLKALTESYTKRFIREGDDEEVAERKAKRMATL